MRAFLLAGGLAAVTAFATFAPPPHVHVERTTWDSVYTAAQSARGDTLYRQSCAKCHGAALEGTLNDGGPLTGAMFLGNWSGLGMDQLFEKAYTTMPSDKPKSLPRKDYADILAYVLARNQFPSGATALPDSMELLRDIKIVAGK